MLPLAKAGAGTITPTEPARVEAADPVWTLVLFRLGKWVARTLGPGC